MQTAWTSPRCAGSLASIQGLCCVDVLVGAIGERHDLAHGRRRSRAPRRRGDAHPAAAANSRVQRAAPAARRRAAAAAGDESGAAAGDVDQLADQVASSARDEIVEVQVDVIDARARAWPRSSSAATPAAAARGSAAR